jgi:hypothetical protein
MSANPNSAKSGSASAPQKEVHAVAPITVEQPPEKTLVVQTSAVPPAVREQVVPAKISVLELARERPLLVKLYDGKAFYQDASFWFSMVALAVTLYNLYSAKKKDTSSRRQSINDEFWLRKVLFPTSIEPVLDFFSATLKSLPPDRFDPTANSTSTENFRKTTIDEYRGVAAKLKAVGILKQTLYDELLDEFEKVEDLITNYCFANKDGYLATASGSDYLQSATGAALSSHMMEMLKSVKKLQETMQ